MIAARPTALEPVPTTAASMREFPGDHESVPEVRSWVQRELAKARPGCSAVPVDVAHLAVLLVSELATNAVRHSDSFRTGGMFAVHLERQARHVRVAVKDEGPAEGHLPAMVHLDDDVADSGRGLRIVASMSTAHGYHYEPSGTTVYFELDWTDCDPDHFPVHRAR
ncbi:ATP-binding protein [Allonocardiopsis opalescens]|uniref:Histidine kinase-like protein n=1 Tax=Allonocardiopsis opalescens TaxID=1144618 RepID=A0A2T0Q2S5_9ACTN|nr:ATP-binding protein [Allonocardiopsis opalescens]PRX98094.1 histidine kinase-like protein [Allonocardiopsis opalescens]